MTEKSEMITEIGLLEICDDLIKIVEGIEGFEYGTFRGENGTRLKDTNEWVKFYVFVRGKHRENRRLDIKDA